MRREEIGMDLEEETRRQVGDRLRERGWTSFTPQPVGPPCLEAFGLSLKDGFSATMVVLPWFEADDDDGPVSVSVLGRVGLDYKPARRLTTALVGSAICGVVFKEPALLAGLPDESKVPDAVDRLVRFACAEAPKLEALADIDTLIRMLEQGRAASSTEPTAFEEDWDEPPPDYPDLPDPRSELIPALLAAAGRFEEARNALIEGDRAAPPGEGSRNYRRLARQLTRWVEARGDLPLPTTPAQWPPMRWPPRQRHTNLRDAFAENYPKAQAKREAVRAVRASSQGKSREEIRALLEQQLRERGGSEEPHSLEMTVDLLATEREPFGRARIALRGVKALWELGGVGRDLFGAARAPVDRDGGEPQPQWLSSPERAAYPILSVRENCAAVKLNPAAQARLADAMHDSNEGVGDTRRIEVWLTWGATTSTPPTSLDVHIGEAQVGHLDGDAAEHFRPAMDAAAERDEDPHASGWLSRISGGMPYLLEVALPGLTE